MPAINYATQYAAALAQAYPNVLHFARYRSTENNSIYRWVNAHTIEVPSIETTGRVDGDRDTIGTAKRNHSNAWVPLALTNHRKWSTLEHPLNIDETNQVLSIQNITKVFNETQKFPEMDAYFISKVYADYIAVEGKAADTTVLTEDNVLSVFDAMMERMDEKNVPQSGRCLSVTPKVHKLIKNAKEMARYIKNGDKSFKRTVHDIDDVEIEVVPSALMKTLYDFTEGFKPGEGAKQINMFLGHPSAIITPEKYVFAQLDAPSAGSEGKWVYFEESFDDTFILKNRIHAIEFNIEG